MDGPDDNPDEAMRRWRWKFRACMAVGFVIGFALMGYLQWVAR